MQKQFADVDLNNTVPHTRDPLHAQSFLVRCLPFFYVITLAVITQSLLHGKTALPRIRFDHLIVVFFAENLNSYILIALNIKVSDI